MSGYPELVTVVDAVASAFRAAGVPWFITGSFASSVHGEFRATNDVDIVAALEPHHVPLVLNPLAERFHVDLEQAHRALTEHASFNLIHRESYLKVDVFPCLSEFDREATRRAEALELPGARESLPIATREDILLAKLRWYRLGGEQSEVQRRDLERLVALNRGELDEPYLRRWAAVLGVSDLLARVLGTSP